MKKDKWQDRLVERLALKYRMDKRVVAEIVYYPFLFTRRVMQSGDERPIRIRHFGVFAYRGSRTKRKFEQHKYDMIIQNAEELYNVYYKDEYESLDHFVEYVIDRFEEADYLAIREVHEIFKHKVKYPNRAETKMK